MRPYNIEIYSKDFDFKSHTTIGGNDPKFNYDYLDPENNKIKVMAPFDVSIYDYIRIKGNDIEIWGSVTKTEAGINESKEFINITFRDIEDQMNIQILVDTDEIGTGTLEKYIADRIKETFIDNSDDEQNIEGLEVQTEGSTTDWVLDITPSGEEEHYAVVNLLDDIILPAFKRDSVRVLFNFSVSEKKIIAKISKNTADPIIIETQLPDVLSKTIKYKSINKEANKVIIYNQKDYEEFETYYLHTDGTFDTVDDDRVSPVSLKIETVSSDTEEDFQSQAYDRANKTFGANKYENLVEIECTNDDERISPLSLEVGQVVNVIDEGNVYETILTGKKIGETTKLIFGNVRLELTKILKGRS